MSNKIVRQTKEMQNLFQDPKFARFAFRAVGGAIAQRAAVKPIVRRDKDGNETFESMVESYTYHKLCEDLKLLGGEQTEPTELEMIMACQAQMARVNAANFVAWRDTIGAKPVDESKIDSTPTNDFSGLSDEELEVIYNLRESKKVAIDLTKEKTNEEETVHPDRN